MNDGDEFIALLLHKVLSEKGFRGLSLANHVANILGCQQMKQHRQFYKSRKKRASQVDLNVEDEREETSQVWCVYIWILTFGVG